MTATTSTTAIEQEQVEAFAGRVVGDIAATMSTIFVALGDKLGLFAALASGGPATPVELAQRTATDERYVREWLHGLTANGYLELDRSTGRFSLPAAHAAVLADEGGLWFLGGGYQELAGMLPVLGRIESAFREGGGVPQAAYADDAYDGMARFTRAWFDHRLPGDWLPVLGDLHSRLESGLRWADVGSGAGRAVIRLAELFPASTFVGYDAFPAQVQRARRAARGRRRRRSGQVRGGRRGRGPAGEVRRDLDVRRRSRRGGPGRTGGGDPPVAGRRRHLPDARDQLRGRPRRQHRTGCIGDVRVQRPLLHDDVAGPGRRGAGDLRLPAGGCRGAGTRRRVRFGPRARYRRSVQPPVRAARMKPRRDLMILVAAVGVSAGGDIGAIAALAVHVQESTHSGLAVASCLLANWLALAVAAPAGGAIVDRADARALLIAASAFQAVVAAALASTPGLPGVLALSVLLGVGGAIAVPAEFALVGAVAAQGPGAKRANARVETARNLGYLLRSSGWCESGGVVERRRGAGVRRRHVRRDRGGCGDAHDPPAWQRRRPMGAPACARRDQAADA